MTSGTVLCLLTALSWGLWTVCLKQATQQLHPAALQAVTTVLNLAVLPVYLYLLRDQTPNLGGRGLFWAIASVGFGALGGLLNLTAMSRMEAGTASAIVATYPAVTMLTLVLVGQETLTGSKALGLILVILGVVALSR